MKGHETVVELSEYILGFFNIGVTLQDALHERSIVYALELACLLN